MENGNIIYNYKFKFNSGGTKNFRVKINENNMELIPEFIKESPDWTLMRNFACPHCPLDPIKVPNCPLASSLSEVIDFFSGTASYEEAEITVESPERIYYKKTSVQIGVSGLLGILMPISGCPITAKLKPMVKFHLPFASLEETQFRVFSSYLLAQLIKKRKGLGEPDWELKNLNLIYKDIEKLNQNVAKKIADLEQKDASINAVVVLNNFANFVTITLDDNDLDFFENLFHEMI